MKSPHARCSESQDWRCQSALSVVWHAMLFILKDICQSFAADAPDKSLFGQASEMLVCPDGRFEKGESESGQKRQEKRERETEMHTVT